ncbi:MAG TPA: gamma-glutamyl-gamma-aminobutyrate hydrolase family protein [Terracidiphilus sp.]|nr:gamma-glutamyl-gamma-aminobutyrate hydrolase family protein [Terracidiphilus sp.]
MTVRIAIPEPTSLDEAYNARSLPAYLDALRSVAAEPVVIPLHLRQEDVAEVLARAHGVLLPGSRFDIDPQSYGETRIPECAPSDPARTAVDELLLQDAFNLHKPILAICGGLQALNVWRNGTLIQDLRTAVNHQPGRHVGEAHRVRITPGSRLAGLLQDGNLEDRWVNSSHHQAVSVIGDNLTVTAASPEDEVIEAMELVSPEHFVLAVQWHPERTLRTSALSLAIFAEFARNAAAWQPREIQESIAR